KILSTNPGSPVQLDVDTMDDGKTQFKRMYICFKEEGLKSNCRGELLTAMGRDSNNQMFPMAWAVVSIENSENWLWFLSHLCSDFNLAMGEYLTILSDGHKGLIGTVKELLPHAEHRLCARHIYANFKKKWIGLHYKSLFWGAAASTLVVHFKHKMELIKNIDPLAYNWLMERDPKAWCRAYFQMDRSCVAFENVAMNQKAVNLNDIVCPSIRKELEKLKQYQRYWLVYPCGQQLFEVRKADEGFGVAAYCMLNQDPVGGSSLWVNSDNPPPLPFKKRIMPSRPRKNRIKHEKGHNRARCYNQTRPKPQQEKRKPGRKSQQAANQLFNPPNADPSVDPSADPSFADSSFADPSVANPSSADPSVTPIFRQGIILMDAEIAAVADMNEAEERKARRKDAGRVLEKAKKKGVYRKRGTSGFKGPYERIKNQMRKKEDPNGPGKQPETALDVSD
ncbi:multidrug resistance-associated protein 5, partial [Tanacetum coccineum]